MVFPQIISMAFILLCVIIYDNFSNNINGFYFIVCVIIYDHFSNNIEKKPNVLSSASTLTLHLNDVHKLVVRSVHVQCTPIKPSSFPLVFFSLDGRTVASCTWFVV
jgi:hypothetical protein